jgi:transposase
MISIKAYNDQLKAFNKAIEQQASIFPNTLQSIPGLGPVYSAGIIAEIGNIHRFKDHAALVKYAGLTWTGHQSGSFTEENTRVIKSGNKYLKYYLVQATNLARMHAPEHRCFYQLKYKQSQHHKHKRTLALTARKFVRLVYALLRDNRLYISPEE